MTSETSARELFKERDIRPSTVASGPFGYALCVLILVGLVTMAASVLTGGISGPVALRHVREHLTAVGIVVAGLSFMAIRTGLRGEAALVGALLACVAVFAGISADVTVERQVTQPGSGGRALVVQTAGALVDGEVCVVVQSGTAPWSLQENVLCRSEDVPEQAVVDAAWAASNRLRITFGDGSSIDHEVR